MSRKPPREEDKKTMSRRQLFLGWREAWKDDEADSQQAQQAQKPAEEDTRLQQARQARKGGDLQAAVALYRPFVKATPQHVQARRELGICLLELGQYIQARVEFERLARDPEPDSPSLFYLGVCLLHLDRPARALQAWERFVSASEEQEPLAGLLREQCALLHADSPPVQDILKTVSGVTVEHPLA